jgi:hypothetical protein
MSLYKKYEDLFAYGCVWATASSKVDKFHLNLHLDVNKKSLLTDTNRYESIVSINSKIFIK